MKKESNWDRLKALLDLNYKMNEVLPLMDLGKKPEAVEKVTHTVFAYK